MLFDEFREMAHGGKRNYFYYHFFSKWREHFVFFFFLRGLKLLSIQFQQNWHFTEEDEYVKEHSLVRFPQYHWNAKQMEVLNCRPDITWSYDSIQLKERV